MDLQRIAHPGLDWREVARLARVHQLEALCWWMWQRSPLSSSKPLDVPSSEVDTQEFPEHLRNRFKLSYLHHLLRNEALLRDLSNLWLALDSHGVEAMICKGPWVAFGAYPDPGTRPIGDIDLCVKEQCYKPAVGAIRSAGWSFAGGLPSSAREALEQSHYRQQLRFFARGRRPVELHFRLVNIGPPRPHEAWLWETASSFGLEGLSLRTPGPEAMLLHLLIHANQHGFSVMRTLYDIRFALTALRGRLDGETFLELVHRYRCGPCCYHGLHLAAELAGADLAELPIEELRPPALRRAISARFWRMNRVRELASPVMPTELEAPLFYLAEMGTWSNKIAYLRNVAAQAGGFRSLLSRARRRLSQNRNLRRETS